MPKTASTRRLLMHKFQQRAVAFVNSDRGARIMNAPGISHVLSYASEAIAKRELGGPSQQSAHPRPASGTDLQLTLDTVVQDVVEILGYSVAMLATYGRGDTLVNRSFYIDPKVASIDQVHEWERQVSAFSPGRPLRITDENVARVDLYDDKFKDNLSVKAARSGLPERSESLFSLFTPIVPAAARPLIDGIQRALDVRMVIAVPFFIEHTSTTDGTTRELVGNLFALKRELITEQDERVLSAFARQAATAILGEQLRLRFHQVQALIYTIQSCLSDEELILQRIVEGVVEDLGYVGAMVATYEAATEALPNRKFYADPQVASREQILEWEQRLADLNPEMPISISNPDIARVYLRDSYKDNLSVQAARSARPKTSPYLYTLFEPVTPVSSRPIVAGIQAALNVRGVIAVPFFLYRSENGEEARELIGNLFALSRSSQFSSGEIELLQAFGQQAAVGLRNAQLYRTVADQRQAAQIFGRMAFSAAASVHTFRNQIATVRMAVERLKLDHEFAERNGRHRKVITEKLDEISTILETLHEPWRQMPDRPTDVNDCLIRALRKLDLDSSIMVEEDLTENLPHINTSAEMLTEAFRVLLKNAAEAIDERVYNGARRQQGRIERGESTIWLTSRLRTPEQLEVSIRDSGIGIKPENMARVFSMRWTTKRHGLGFGLYWTKDFIEGLEGTVELESMYGQGTTFRVLLPTNATAPESSADDDTSETLVLHT